MAEDEDGRRAVFDRLFADGGDPWDLEDSGYERAKRAATLAALGQRRYRSGLEIGCAFGLLTQGLAQRCERLLALDVSDLALARARDKLAGEDHVAFRRAEVPRDWPEGWFDCLVWSEVLYFLSAGEIRQSSAAAWQALEPGGVCVLVNWTGANDLPVDGEEAAELFIGGAAWRPVEQKREAQYRLDVLER